MARTESQKAKQKEWRSKNWDKVLASRKRYVEKNREKVREYAKVYAIKYYEKMPESVRKYRILEHAKQNAAAYGVEFSLTRENVVWNTVCPVFGIPLNYGKPSNGKLSHDTASLDRTDCTKGYTPDNVIVMSWRANRLKSDATLHELCALAAYMTKTETPKEVTAEIYEIQNQA